MRLTPLYVFQNLAFSELPIIGEKSKVNAFAFLQNQGFSELPNVRQKVRLTPSGHAL